MRVILIKDVPGLGKIGDIKEVANGYGRNYLIRRGLASLATTGEIKQAAQHRRTAAKRQTRDLADARAMVERLTGMTLTFEAHAGEGTKLYESITSGDIAEKISQELGRDFDRRKIHLEESLRQLGTHQVPIRLTAELGTEVTVIIEREGEKEESAE